MMHQADTLSNATTDVTATPAAHVRHGVFHTPEQILRTLPATATPWQQDSALRANYKYQDIDWAARPNPLRTPTTKADPKAGDFVSHPMYYSHSLVQPDSIYRPECVSYRHGVAGDPVPYTIAGDSLITSILLACFIFAAVAISASGNFLQRQLKSFFRVQREGTTVITETSGEMRFQFFLVAQTCLLAAIIVFFFSQSRGGESFAIAHYQIIGLFTGEIAAYLLLKALLYQVVNWVFFDKKKNEQWMKSYLFLICTEGILFFPAVLLLSYFGLPITETAIYAFIVVILAKLLSFYKAYIIFFKRTVSIVQSFLYFCALEIMPLGILMGVLAMTDNYIKQIF